MPMTVPQPGKRLRPTRAGVINLWDYRDEEFSFVDGWLVLRGPNGSGKTKALEVLFPFVLDGRIEPRRLNPFAGVDRTMKSNLLYRGQEVAHSYVWMEFGDGSRYVTVGIGLRAHRHADRVTRWHFVTDGRVGVNFSLLDADDRPLTRRDLIAQLGPDAVKDTAEEHRHLVDARLFGLGRARYEQLLDLVLTLRKPQLAKDLDPVELSRTLQRGLRPLDDQLIAEAAGSFDDMEAVARVLAGLVAADAACGRFLGVYSTYLRTHARAAADALTARRRAIEERTEDWERARAEVRRAAEAETEAATTVARLEPEPGRWRERLDGLRASAAYQSHQQLASLERHVRHLAETAELARSRYREEHDGELRAAEAAGNAERRAADARRAADRAAAELSGEAEAAGIDWRTDDAEPADLRARLGGRVTARKQDVRAVRQALDEVARKDRERERAAEQVTVTAEAVTAAEQALALAEGATEAAREDVRTRVGGWLEHHGGMLAKLGPDVDWSGLGSMLTAAVDAAGEIDAPSLGQLYADATAPPAAARLEELVMLRSRRSAVAEERAAVAAERERIAAERDDAPPAPATRTTARDGRPGAPLWCLVRFGPHVPERDAAGLEAALQAAGLLDAWVDPAPDGGRTGDGYLVPLPPHRRPAGPTLDQALEVEDQDHVPAERVRAVLASIAFTDISADDVEARNAVGATGRYAQGVGVGGHLKPAAEFIGATARAARRAARLANCDRRLAELDTRIAELGLAADTLSGLLDEVASAARTLPSLALLHERVRAGDRAAVALSGRREAAAAAAAGLDRAVAEQSVAHAALRRTTAERSLAADRLDAVDAAVDRFALAGQRLESALDAADRELRSAVTARERHAEASERAGRAEAARQQAEREHSEQEAGYDALRSSIGADAEQVLDHVQEAERELSGAETALVTARAAAATALEARAAAGARTDELARTVGLARTEAHQESLRLRPYAHPDLLGLLRCPTGLRWPAIDRQPGAADPAEGGAELPPEIVALHDALLAATRELSPTESSLKQSATRLTAALNELQAELPATGLDHRPEWDTDDGVIVVRVADEQGYSPVAHFAERISRERADQERLLTDAEQRVLEDALLGQLARQIHHRTIEARDLVAAMDEQMRARRMSSGLTVGVGWQLADHLDPQQREICRLLERDPARLGPAELASLRRHFAGRIKAARADSPEQGYRELLAEVLDYRRWRAFAFTLHRPSGGSDPLTRARHSQLSGGEQSVSLHLPLFAAANALFGSAREDAPRLLGLDEAFAGVDENGRGELMSLAQQFDLDLFMTGYDLWVTHPSVGGAAHYDLSHSAVEHTVSTVLLVWDGSANVADFDGTLVRALGSPGRRHAGDERAGGDRPGELALDGVIDVDSDPSSRAVE
jgi:uncharacterized protein (TIGR02680 family)